MKLSTAIITLLGFSAVAVPIGYTAAQGPHYQIVMLTQSRIARLEQRTGAIDYCRVVVADGDRAISCAD